MKYFNFLAEDGWAYGATIIAPDMDNAIHTYFLNVASLDENTSLRPVEVSREEIRDGLVPQLMPVLREDIAKEAVEKELLEIEKMIYESKQGVVFLVENALAS